MTSQRSQWPKIAKQFEAGLASRELVWPAMKRVLLLAVCLLATHLGPVRGLQWRGLNHLREIVKELVQPSQPDQGAVGANLSSRKSLFCKSQAAQKTDSRD